MGTIATMADSLAVHEFDARSATWALDDKARPAVRQARQEAGQLHRSQTAGLGSASVEHGEALAAGAGKNE
jgi:hypothetical protein